MSELERIKKKAERWVGFVKGYHPGYPVDEVAVKEGLEHRVAFIINPYRSEKEDSFFDVELFCSLMKGITDVLQSDNLTVRVEEYERYGGKELDSLESFERHMRSLPECDQKIPRRIVYSRGEKIVCCVSGELWVLCGGPWPYHDCYTASVYTKEDFSEQLAVLCEEVCNRVGATIWKVFEESPIPVPEKNWRTWVRSFIKGLFKKNR
ncbi:MAG: hypothetical protein ACYS8Z_21800 [Planctomycetota bacterium]|jgi:hypothetical protein